MPQKKRTFSCPEYGNPYDAYQPDDLLTRVTLDKSEAQSRAAGRIKEITHDCLYCKYPITLHGYRPKLSISRG